MRRLRKLQSRQARRAVLRLGPGSWQNLCRTSRRFSAVSWTRARARAHATIVPTSCSVLLTALSLTRLDRRRPSPREWATGTAPVPPIPFCWSRACENAACLRLRARHARLRRGLSGDGRGSSVPSFSRYTDPYRARHHISRSKPTSSSRYRRMQTTPNYSALSEPTAHTGASRFLDLASRPHDRRVAQRHIPRYSIHSSTVRYARYRIEGKRAILECRKGKKVVNYSTDKTDKTLDKYLWLSSKSLGNSEVIGKNRHYQ